MPLGSRAGVPLGGTAGQAGPPAPPQLLPRAASKPWELQTHPSCKPAKEKTPRPWHEDLTLPGARANLVVRAGAIHLPGDALNGSFSRGLSFVFLLSQRCCINNSDISPEASVGSAGLSPPGHGVVPGMLRTCWLQPPTGFLVPSPARWELHWAGKKGLIPLGSLLLMLQLLTMLIPTSSWELWSMEAGRKRCLVPRARRSSLGRVTSGIPAAKAQPALAPRALPRLQLCCPKCCADKWHQWLEELRDEGDESGEGAGVKLQLLSPQLSP